MDSFLLCKQGVQLSLTNPKNAGRPALHYKVIRHCARAEINRPSPLHLTIKLNRAHIQNKTILKHLKYAISRARLQGLKIIHFSLEYDHVHLYAESTSNIILTKSMKALGVSFSKRLNKFFKTKGRIYKTRFHLRILRSASEVKNVIHYILKNGVKHKRASSYVDPYNSWVVLHDFRLLGPRSKMCKNQIEAYIHKYYQKEYKEYRRLLDHLILYERELRFLL